MPSELHPYAVLLRPLITEKSTVLAGDDKYVFEVDLRANKNQIKEAVELAFDVKVADVNTMKMKGKNKRFKGFKGRRSDAKKAIVTLEEGQTIETGVGI